MTNEQKAEFINLADRHLRLLRDLYREVQLKYWGRFLGYGPIASAVFDELTGVPSSLQSAIRTAGIAYSTLEELAPQVPAGGPPHGTPENWVSVWIDLADSTEKNLNTAAQVLRRTSPLVMMSATWEEFSKTIGGGLNKAADTAQIVGAAAIVLGLAWIFRRK